MRCPSCQNLNPDDAGGCSRCGTAFVRVSSVVEDPLRLGAVLGGRYELTSRLGSGAMGQVFAARDRSLGRAVALKVLTPELWQSRRARERMAREAAALARIRHPNVVGIHDVFEDGGALVLALELVTGGTLAERLRSGPPPVEQALAVVDALLAGLEAIHREGVVHRDIKPANVLLAADGTPKIADLGVARDATVQALTATGVQLGTLDYMSPEQIQGGEITPATDVYACGALLFELITGAPPFIGRTDFEVMAAHLTQVPNFTTVEARTSAALVHVLARALAKPPAERWPTAPAFREALAAVARLGGWLAWSAPPPLAYVRPSLERSSHPPHVVEAGFVSRSSPSRSVPDGRRRRSRARRKPPPEPIGPGTMVVNALTQPTTARAGWCFPVALLIGVLVLAAGLLLLASLVLGIRRFGGGLP